MKVPRIWLAAIGFIILSSATLFLACAEIIAPNFNGYLPYFAILVMAWVFCVPSVVNLPKLIGRAKQGLRDDDIKIELSRRTVLIGLFLLVVGFVPPDHTPNVLFGKIVGLGIALMLASFFKQRKPVQAVEGS